MSAFVEAFGRRPIALATRHRSRPASETLNIFDRLNIVLLCLVIAPRADIEIAGIYESAPRSRCRDDRADPFEQSFKTLAGDLGGSSVVARPDRVEE